MGSADHYREVLYKTVRWATLTHHFPFPGPILSLSLFPERVREVVAVHRVLLLVLVGLQLPLHLLDRLDPKFPGTGKSYA